MKILIIHQNFPAQFNQLVQTLLAEEGHEIIALMQPPGKKIEGVGVLGYKYLNTPSEDTHPLLKELEAKTIRGEAVQEAAIRLKQKGWNPEVILGHPGWGELLFIRDVWPKARLVVYAEYYYRTQGQDLDFDPEFNELNRETVNRMVFKNAVMLSAVSVADRVYTPTLWQRDTFPKQFHKNIQVIHDGIDTEFFKPNPNAAITIENKGVRLKKGDEIITYAARALEPVRGIHTFLRALPEVLKKRPKAHVLIMGAEQASYGVEPTDFSSWQQFMLNELGDKLDANRVHFTGFLPKETYLQALQISKVHIYLTYPFILSWSMLEAMACGAVVIGSNTGPVIDVLDESNGYLLDFFDSKKLSQTIISELKSKKKNPRSEAGRQTIIDNFNQKDSIVKLKKLILN